MERKQMKNDTKPSTTHMVLDCSSFSEGATFSTTMPAMPQTQLRKPIMKPSATN